MAAGVVLADCGGASPRRLRQAWPCGGSSRVVGFADFAVSGGLGLARRNSLRSLGAHCAQTAAASQFTKRATGAPRPRPSDTATPENRPHRARPAAANQQGGAQPVIHQQCFYQGVCAQALARLRGAEMRRGRGRTRSVHQPLTCGGCLNGALQARSEFCRVATASSIAGEPVRSTGHLVEAPAPGRTRLGRQPSTRPDPSEST